MVLTEYQKGKLHVGLSFLMKQLEQLAEFVAETETTFGHDYLEGMEDRLLNMRKEVEQQLEHSPYPLENRSS